MAKMNVDEDGYDISVQLNKHLSPVRCVVAVNDDIIVSGGRKNGEFIEWKRNNNKIINSNDNSNNNDNDNDVEMKDDDTKNNTNNKPSNNDSNSVDKRNFKGDIIFSEKFHPLVFCLSFYDIQSESNVFVSGGSDYKAIVWNSKQEILYELKGHTGNINSIDITKDGKIITGSYDATAKVWDKDKCLYTLSGHLHGVEVCALDSGEIITGTYKDIYIWSNKGKQIKSIKFAHDHMIRKIRKHPLGFISCANDGYVKIWTNKGEIIRKVEAHPINGDIPSFIYGLACFKNGNFISCGEDGTVKIFNADCFLQEPLRHPGAVWDVSILPNGDIVTACADRCVRIWSKDSNRKANKDAIMEYRKHLQMTLDAQSNIDIDKLEPPSALLENGKKPGDIKMINDPKRGPSVYQWDISKREWVYIGEILGKKVGNDSKKSGAPGGMLNGKKYDHITYIDLNGDQQVPLGFMRDDDPKKIARDWCVIHSVDLDLAPQVEKHVKQFIDPQARAKRIESERIAASKALKHTPNYKVCSFEINGKLKLAPMKKKIIENNQILIKDKNIYGIYQNNGNDMKTLELLFNILSDQSNWHVNEFPDIVVKLIDDKMLKWPTKMALPVLDMMRCLMTHSSALNKLMNLDTIKNSILNHCSEDNDECNGNMQMIISRLVSNYIAKRSRSEGERRGDINSIPNKFFQFISECLSNLASAALNKKSSIYTAYIMMAHNTMLWYSKFKIDESDIYLIIASAIFEMINEQQLNDKILYYSISLLATIAWASKTAKTEMNVCLYYTLIYIL